MTILSALMASCLAVTAAANPAPVAEGAGPFRVVGYLPDYRASDFDPVAARGVTDLVLFSAEPTSSGGLDLSRLKGMPWAKLRDFKTSEKARLILCVGGWGRSDRFAEVAASPEKRSAFARDAARACLDKGLDGIDLDWEHPGDAAQEAGYAGLLGDLHREFAPRKLALSVTVAAWQKLPAEAFRAVDLVHLMAYDHTGRHSTFASARSDVRALTEAGVPPARIVLGLPFYGRDNRPPRPRPDLSRDRREAPAEARRRRGGRRVLQRPLHDPPQDRLRPRCPSGRRG